MREETGLLVGMDICEDFIQLTYFDYKLLSPESISREEGEEQYLIPMRFAYRRNKNDWIIGDELDNEEPDDITEIKDFVKTITNKEKIKVYDKNYERDKLMNIFIREVLKILNIYHQFKEIRCIGITFQNVTKELADIMASALKEFGIEKEKYILLNHDEAFLYYTINQKQELWANDTALFELEEDGLHFRILNIDKESEPMMARISRKEKSEKLTKEMVKLDRNESGNMFYTLSLMALEGSVVSTVYAVGRGFIDNWGDATLRKLSPGRRVFRGQNLYAKGACLAARDKTMDEPANIVLIGEDRTTTEFSIMAVKDGKIRETVLLKPWLKWYEAEAETDIIIKGENELGIQIKDFLTEKVSRRFISFSGVNGAESGMTRIRLSLKFKDRDTCIIKAADLGFGFFVPTTNRVWELIWEK